MRIEYGHINDEGIEEVEDPELVAALKEVENEKPMSENDQNEFMKWLNEQV